MKSAIFSARFAKVMGPSGPHVVGDANERLDRDQCRGAEHPSSM